MAQDVMRIFDFALTVLVVVFAVGAMVWAWNEWEGKRQRKKDD